MQQWKVTTTFKCCLHVDASVVIKHCMYNITLTEAIIPSNLSTFSATLMKAGLVFIMKYLAFNQLSIFLPPLTQMMLFQTDFTHSVFSVCVLICSLLLSCFSTDLSVTQRCKPAVCVFLLFT